MNANMSINIAAQAQQAFAAEIAKIDKTADLGDLNKKAVANMVVESLGEELIKTALAGMPNAPQFLKEKVETAIRTAMENSKQEVSGEAQGTANINEAAKTLVTGIVAGVNEEISTAIKAEVGDVSQMDDTSLKADSWLMALAAILGKIADQKLDNLFKAGKELGGLGEGEDGFGTKSAQLTASAKIFSIVMEATTNVLKTTGDGITTAARK